MDVDCAGAPEEVITPHLLQQLRPGEHPAGVLSEVLQQFEFLVGQVKWTAAQTCGVSALVDDELPKAYFAGTLLVGQSAAAANQQSQPSVNLGGAGAR